jgi:hypothetical protein
VLNNVNQFQKKKKKKKKKKKSQPHCQLGVEVAKVFAHLKRKVLKDVCRAKCNIHTIPLTLLYVKTAKVSKKEAAAASEALLIGLACASE